MEVQKTALYNIHKNLGAKFVPFAGYEMPIQYKDGIVKEHISTRTYAGFFDVSHMGQFFLEGDETLTEALEKIIPADLKSLKKKGIFTISTDISPNVKGLRYADAKIICSSHNYKQIFLEILRIKKQKKLKLVIFL